MRKLLLLLVATLLLTPLGFAQAPASSFDEAVKESRAAIAESLSRSGTPGMSVAVAIGGRLVWAEGFGFADVEQKVAVKPETKFGIGSISKSLTAAVFARYAQRGVVNWDAPVEQYLPEFPHRDRGVTARMIATHLSGYEDSFDSQNRSTTIHYTGPEALRVIMHQKLLHAPGTGFSYATGSYTILAGILERATGKAFPELIKEELIIPLGLQDTTPNDPRAVILNRTRFYEQTESGTIENGPCFNPSYKLAGAGYLSSAPDLARFGVALLQGQVVSGANLKELFEPAQTRDGRKPSTGFGEYMRINDTGVGLGWSLGEDAQGPVIHQPGGGIGISAWLVLYPEEDLVVVILSNLTGAPVGGRALRTTVEAFRKAKP